MNATDDLITQIPLDQLHESPFNPRKTFTGIDELATSILAEGRVHQPLLVRPRMTDPTAANPADMFDGYEIVFGHRRYRAAERAGLRTVPCMVRSMTGAEARSAQIAENLQRSDVHPFEEAEGFDLLMKSDERTADDLAVMFGKSRSYIYGRLKLLQAVPEVRQACLRGEIGAEVALLVARQQTQRLQVKALAAIKNDTSSSANMEDGGKRSYRHIRDMLAEKFTLPLRAAIFPIADATLLPDAGACPSCPKRTGNAPEFEDLAAVERDGEHRGYRRPGGADVCTDPECWDAKKKAHLQREADQLAATGKAVVTGNKARQALDQFGAVKASSAFVDAKTAKAALKKAQLKPGAQRPAVQWIQDQRTGRTVQAYARADLVAAGLASAAPADKGKAQAQHEADSRKARDEAYRRAEEKAVAINAGRLAVLARVRENARSHDRTQLELRLVTEAAVAGVEWGDKELLYQLQGVKSEEGLLKKLHDMDAFGLGLVLLDCALVVDLRYDQHRKPKAGNLTALAQQYGVDVKATQAEATGAARDTATGDLLASADVDEAAEAEA